MGRLVLGTRAFFKNSEINGVNIPEVEKVLKLNGYNAEEVYAEIIPEKKVMFHAIDYTESDLIYDKQMIEKSQSQNLCTNNKKIWFKDGQYYGFYSSINKQGLGEGIHRLELFDDFNSAYAWVKTL